MTRIVAGSARGRILRVPQKGTRPTSDRVREALFSRLQHEGILDEAHVLDLYAGSGALGLEAISRGAQRAVLVEKSPRAAQICVSNARSLGMEEQVTIAQRPVLTHLSKDEDCYDLILIDPPYDIKEADLAAVLAQLTSHLVAGAVVVIERSKRSPEPVLPAELMLFDARNYGETALWFVQER